MIVSHLPIFTYVIAMLSFRSFVTPLCSAVDNNTLYLFLTSSRAARFQFVVTQKNAAAWSSIMCWK